MKAGNIIIGLCLVFLLSACASISVDTRRNEALSIADKAGFQPLRLRSKLFELQGFYKMGENTRIPVIYIEGDGLAWIDRYTISKNPTPKKPLALKLATIDTSPTVFYLARPCQYVDLKNELNCTNAYWTNARFSIEVIQSFNQVLDQIKASIKADGFHLVGFSGGGAIVTLLAADRNDIKSIRTIAGNLNHVALNKSKNVSPLVGSMNPIDVIHDIKYIPQIHYSGSDDVVVPEWVAGSFVKIGNNSKCMSTHLVTGVEHLMGWESIWSRLHKQIPSC